jgi:hypothetical protein
MEKNTKYLIGGVSAAVVIGVVYYIWKKSKDKNTTIGGGGAIPDSPLGNSMLATTLQGAKLMSNASDKSALIDYVDEGETLFITGAKYAENSWWYKASSVPTSSGGVEDGWIKQTYLIGE